jgi:hypothetical protein
VEENSTDPSFPHFTNESSYNSDLDLANAYIQVMAYISKGFHAENQSKIIDIFQNTYLMTTMNTPVTSYISYSYQTGVYTKMTVGGDWPNKFLEISSNSTFRVPIPPTVLKIKN